MFKPTIVRRKIPAGSAPKRRNAAGYTVLLVQTDGTVFSVRTIDLQAYSNACNISLDQAKTALLASVA